LNSQNTIQKFTFINIHSRDSSFNCLGYSNNESVNSDVISHTVERRAVVGGMGVAKQEAITRRIFSERNIR
jgi:hypothetical protein